MVEPATQGSAEVVKFTSSRFGPRYPEYEPGDQLKSIRAEPRFC